MNTEEIKTGKQRKVSSEIIFNDTGDFMAYYKATSWLTENGYSYGSMSSPFPTGILKGDYNIAKWKNLTSQQIRALDGVIVADGRFREGPCRILLYTSNKK
jgi:hypothetical protein